MTSTYTVGQEVQLRRGVGIVDEVIPAGTRYFALENHPRGHGLVERETVANENRYHVAIPVVGYAVTSGSWHTESELDSFQR